MCDADRVLNIYFPVKKITQNKSEERTCSKSEKIQDFRGK